MSDPTSTPNDAFTDPTIGRSLHLLHADAWLRNLPYGVVLVLTLVGVAYTSFSKHPLVAYWEFIVPVMGVVCIGTGWRHAHDKQARLRLIWTQALHWLAFVVAMNLMLLPSVQNMLNSDRNRACHSLVACTRHVRRRRTYPCLAGLPSRPHHGALRSSDRLDRRIGPDRAAGCDRASRSGNDVLVERQRPAGGGCTKRSTEIQ
jgi:hypothetical protein